MSNAKTITLYATLDGQIWATSKDMQGAYAVRQQVGGMHYLLGHFGHIQPRRRVDEEYLSDPEDIAGHPFAWITYDSGDDTTLLKIDPFVVNEYGAAGRFLVGERDPRTSVEVEL